ncbi:hypothetical protein DL98DRAFT_29356 [Cadophora sp. DSE1049]|jgi:hypothetical protein|nr:hypothetical protein DL98DRAFT_29356 [Cadophora sp. DSE1049]
MDACHASASACISPESRSFSPVPVSIAPCGIPLQPTNQTNQQAKVRPEQIKQKSTLHFHFQSLSRYAKSKAQNQYRLYTVETERNDVKYEERRSKKCVNATATMHHAEDSAVPPMLSCSLAREINDIVRLRRNVKGPEGRMQRDSCRVLSACLVSVLSCCVIRRGSPSMLDRMHENVKALEESNVKLRRYYIELVVDGVHRVH